MGSTKCTWPRYRAIQTDPSPLYLTYTTNAPLIALGIKSQIDYDTEKISRKEQNWNFTDP